MILPSVLYAALVLAAILYFVSRSCGLFVSAAATLGLLLIGIRNAWDTVTHIVAMIATNRPTKPE